MGISFSEPILHSLAKLRPYKLCVASFASRTLLGIFALTLYVIAPHETLASFSVRTRHRYYIMW